MIGFVDNAGLSDGLKEARPSAGTRKLGIGPEEHVAADGAEISPLCVVIQILPRKSFLCRLFPGNGIEVGREDLLPNGIADM